MAAARFIVSGTVQGVFFRASTREEAARLDLSGVATNLSNGDVDVLAIGDSDALDALEQWLRRGPPMAVVELVIRHNLTEPDLPEDVKTGFAVR